MRIQWYYTNRKDRIYYKSTKGDNWEYVNTYGACGKLIDELDNIINDYMG